MNASSAQPAHSNNRVRPPWRKWLIGGGIGLLLLGLITPWVIANTPIRNWLLTRILGMPSLSASIGGASVGWMSPLEVRGVELRGKQNRFKLEVESIRSESSWPRLISSTSDLGEITIEKPHLHLDLPLGVHEQPSSDLAPTLTANINDAALSFRYAKIDRSIVEIEGIDMKVEISNAAPGRLVAVEPMTVFDRQEITPKLCSRLLNLFVPSLHDSTRMGGQFSLRLSEMTFPIGVPDEQVADELKIAGELGLHQVEIDSESRLLQSLSRIVADIHERAPPESTRVIKDAVVKFRAEKGRLYHEGLELGFPDIDPNLKVTSWGSVGIDETLDVYVDVPRLDEEMYLKKGPVHCHITGTLGNPRLQATDASLVLRLPERDEPLLDVDGIDLDVQIESNDDGADMVFQPVQIFDHQQIQSESIGSLVKWIDPDIEYSPELSGSISLNLDELRIPIGLDEAELRNSIELHGRLSFHDMKSVANTPVRKAIVKLLADLYSVPAPDGLQTTKDAEVTFSIRDGHIRFDGLQIGFPEIDPSLVVTSRGTIGIDESLDIHFDIPRINQAKRTDRGPVHAHLTGTVKAPVLSVTDASLVLQLPDRPDPLFDVDGIDVTLRILETPDGPVMSFDPVELLHQETITRRLAGGLMRWVDPDISYSPQLIGEVSLGVETLVIPLQLDKHWINRLQSKGTLTVHEVSSVAETPLRRAMVKLLSDFYGKPAKTVNRVVHDANVQFELRDGRLHYEGLKIGFPDISPDLVIRSAGSLGLDESLDVMLQFPRIDPSLAKVREPATCHITGDIGNPKLAVRNAAFAVRLPGEREAILKAESIDVAMSIRTRVEEPYLELEPVTLLDHKQLTAQDGGELLRLVAPALGDVAKLKGSISLHIDKLHLPLRQSLKQSATDFAMDGRLTLHDITTTVETPLLQAMIKVLADLYDKKAEGEIRIAQDTELRFSVHDGRLYHDGLELGFPDISPELVGSSRGSIGFDQTLDLTIEVPAVLAKATAQTESSGGTVWFKVTGTMDDPRIKEVNQPASNEKETGKAR